MEPISFIKSLLGGLPGVDNSTNINIENIVIAEDGETEITEDGSVKISKDELDEGKLKEGFDEDVIDSFQPIDSAEEIEDIQKHVGDQEIEETLEYFNDLIRKQHLEALEAALYMRKLVEEENRDPEKIKQDIKSEYGAEGRKISTLCSAGYFDKGNYLRELHKNMEEEEKFEERFDEIVRYLPFTVFVSRWNNKKDVMIELRRKLLKYNKYSVRFVDVRGIGEQNIDKIQKVVTRLDEELDSLEYSERERDEELRVRINPKSIDHWEHVEEVKDNIEE